MFVDVGMCLSVEVGALLLDGWGDVVCGWGFVREIVGGLGGLVGLLVFKKSIKKKYGSLF